VPKSLIKVPAGGGERQVHLVRVAPVLHIYDAFKREAISVLVRHELSGGPCGRRHARADRRRRCGAPPDGVTNAVTGLRLHGHPIVTSPGECRQLRSVLTRSGKYAIRWNPLDRQAQHFLIRMPRYRRRDEEAFHIARTGRPRSVMFPKDITFKMTPYQNPAWNALSL
jgi:hypothetical protein